MGSIPLKCTVIPSLAMGGIGCCTMLPYMMYIIISEKNYYMYAKMFCLLSFTMDKMNT